MLAASRPSEASEDGSWFGRALVRIYMHRPLWLAYTELVVLKVLTQVDRAVETRAAVHEAAVQDYREISRGSERSPVDRLRELTRPKRGVTFRLRTAGPLIFRRLA